MVDHIKELLLQHSEYAYLVIFLWTFIEGETVLLVAGALAGSGALDIRWTILTAFIGTLLGDQAIFYLGRWKGEWLLRKMGKKRALIDKALVLLEKNATWLLLTYRFIYGLRNITSISVGLSHIPARRFLLLNTISSITWAISFGLSGYWLGDLLYRHIDTIKKYEREGIGLLIILGLVIWLIRRKRTPPQEMIATPTTPTPSSPNAEAPSPSPIAAGSSKSDNR